MTGNSRGTDPDSESSEMTKPSCTINERQDQLLDELAETRHASRSEALRAAIEEYSQNISDEGRNIEEQMLQFLTSLTNQIQNIDDKLDRLEDDTRIRSAPNHAQNKSSKPARNQAVTTVEDGKDGHELENDVYQILSQSGPLSLGSIASELDSDEIDVREALDCLVKREYVTRVDHSDDVKYNIKPAH